MTSAYADIVSCSSFIFLNNEKYFIIEYTTLGILEIKTFKELIHVSILYPS